MSVARGTYPAPPAGGGSRPGGGASRLRRRLFGGLAVGLGVLLLAEGTSRLLPVPDAAAPWSRETGEVTGDILLDGNPWLLWELRVGARLEHGVTVHVNRAGFRDRERGPKTRPRALALGDSSVYGFGVRDEEVFTSVLEERVDADFVNAAAPGYSTFQSINLLDMRGWSLDPDLLIVANLWSDNNFDSFVDKELLASYAGWSGSRAGAVRALLGYSHLFRGLDWTLRVAPRGEAARKVGWQLGDVDPRGGRRRVAIEDYAANLEALCERMRARGGGVVFLMLANREDLRPRAGRPAWAPYREVMADTARRHGAPLVDAPAAFRASGLSRDRLFLDQMHPAPEGHALLAEAVAAELARQGWPAAPLRVGAASAPRPTWEDPFERADGTLDEPVPSVNVATVSVEVEVIVPQYQRGAILVELANAAVGGPRTALASGSRDGPGRVRLTMPALPEQVRVRVTLDEAGDGPGAGDRFAWVGPLELDLDAPSTVDFSAATFESGDR